MLYTSCTRPGTAHSQTSVFTACTNCTHVDMQPDTAYMCVVHQGTWVNPACTARHAKSNPHQQPKPHRRPRCLTLRPTALTTALTMVLQGLHRPLSRIPNGSWPWRYRHLHARGQTHGGRWLAARDREKKWGLSCDPKRHALTNTHDACLSEKLFLKQLSVAFDHLPVVNAGGLHDD